MLAIVPMSDLLDWESLMPNFISNHGLVLLRIILGIDSTVSQIADDVNVSEQTAHAIVRELVKEGFITSQKVGRRNVYRGRWIEGFNHKPLTQSGLTLRDIFASLAALAEMMATTKARVLLRVAEGSQSTAGEIAESEIIKKADVSNALRELEKDKLVLRRRSAGKITYVVHPLARSQHEGALNVVEEIRLVRLARVKVRGLPEILDDIFGPVQRGG